jgi:cystathionine beta-lyase
MIDLPALAALAKRRGLLLVADNTWGSGLQYRPLELGADVSIIAATKYLSGHSDVMMGAVTAGADAWGALTDAADDWGMTASPDDAYLVLRGARSLSARLAVHEANALAIARWLGARPEVARVFCPALPDHPGHDLWRRDCAGTNGLVSFELRTRDTGAAERFADALELFGIGASWGGYESLVVVADLARARTVDDWSACGPVIRLHAGLEDAADLIRDLERGFEAARIERS